MRRLRYGLSALACAGLTTGMVVVPATAGAQPGPSPRVAIAGNVPAWTSTTTAVGTLRSNKQLHLEIALPIRDAFRAASLAEQVSTPGSASYGRFLSPAQYNQRFAPTTTAVASVARFLTSQGMRVDSVAPNRHVVSVTATVGQAQRAFSTTLRTYRVGGQQAYAPSSAVSVPASVSSEVAAVIGLDSRPQAHTNYIVNKYRKLTHPNGTYSGCADDTYFGQHPVTGPPPPLYKSHESRLMCGYDHTQITGAYNMPNSSTAGAGQTIAIVDAYDLRTAASDVGTYSRNHGLPALKPGQLVFHDASGGYTNPPPAGCQGPSGWAGEQMLDLESTHTMAPGANIKYYGAKDCNHLFTTLNYVIATKGANLISNSYGGSEGTAAGNRAIDTVLEQAALQGIGVYASTGDSGDESTATSGARQVEYPAASKWVTAVGGTSLAVGANSNRLFETGWEGAVYEYNGTAWVKQSAKVSAGFGTFGAGGGTSSAYSEPSWQQGVVPASIAKGHRALPDIGALADPYTGFIFGYTMTGGYAEGAVGGTSLACPLVASMVARAQQSQHKAIGLLTPALYRAAKRASVIRDVSHLNGGIGDLQTQSGTPATIAFDAKPESLQSTPGWDNVTGVGAPNGTGFLTGITK